MLRQIKSKIKKILEPKYKPVFVPVISGNYLKNKTVLITGGSSGIGYSIAEAALKNGANVIITGRNEKKLNLACNKLNMLKNEGRVYKFVFDISEVDKIEINFNNILDNIDGKLIDILVNNAGVNTDKKFGNNTIEEYDKVLNTNLKGTYFLSQVVSNYMISKKIKGNILMVESSSSLRPVYSPYTLSKWGGVGLTLGLAKKLIKYDIVVNGIGPGPTATAMLTKDNSNLYKESSPIKRYITAEEIANIAIILISDMGRAIVGDIVYVSGGSGTITYDDVIY